MWCAYIYFLCLQSLEINDNSSLSFLSTCMNLHLSQLKQLLLDCLTLAEIEQLLEPEERDILKQNATPNVDRISTVSI